MFNNLGTFLVESAVNYEDLGGAASSFVNEGSLNNSADFDVFVPFTNEGSLTIAADFVAVASFNVPGGSVDIQTGRLVLEQGGSSTGAAFNIESNGFLEFWTPYTFDTSTTITGTGELHHIDFDFPLVLPGNYTFTGTTAVDAGTLQVNGSLAGSTMLLTGGTLTGTGTVGPISATLGAVSPGVSPDPGILNANGPVSLEASEDSGGGLVVLLNGTMPGTGYSQLNASGEVDLDPDGSQLDASLGSGFTPANGEKFTIIKSTVPIVGNFQGLPEGASLTIGNTLFTITYVGGDGDDVVLTQAVAAAPTVTGINPSSGPAAGDTLVTITGTGFTGATVVDFGTTAATNVTVVNNTTITADSPPGTGVVDVTVTTPVGTSATSSAGAFTYIALAAPTVTGVSPNSGPAAGGTLVTITGTGFSDVAAVDFGTTAATNVTVVNDTTITADSPAGTGTVNVTVITRGGTSAISAADQFTYVVLRQRSCLWYASASICNRRPWS